MTKELVKDIAIEILRQAVEDWRGLMRLELDRVEHPDKIVRRPLRIESESSFNEIRAFFGSDYCTDLCDILNLDSDRVLSKLEDDLALQRDAYPRTA